MRSYDYDGFIKPQTQTSSSFYQNRSIEDKVFCGEVNLANISTEKYVTWFEKFILNNGQGMWYNMVISQI